MIATEMELHLQKVLLHKLFVAVEGVHTGSNHHRCHFSVRVVLRWARFIWHYAVA